MLEMLDPNQMSALSFAGSNESEMEEVLSQDSILKSIESPRERCEIYRFMDNYFNMTDQETGWCPYYFDDFLCWPQSPPNTTVVLECPKNIRGIQYESSYNVTRNCGPDGHWVAGNYSGCAALFHESELPIPWIHLRIMYCIYWFGYAFSLIFLLLALAVFVRYKKLWCLRNIIHCNLILCFALHNSTWIVYSLVANEFLTKVYGLEEVAYCYIPTTILKYFIAAGFFWMFIEGVYLLFSVVFSFHAKRIRFWMCAIVGWGMRHPEFFWMFRTTFTFRGVCAQIAPNVRAAAHTSTIVVPLLLLTITTIVKAKSDRAEECWNEQHHLDYIFIGPVLCILLLNVVFLVVIMYVVVTKLQITVPVEATRYKKAIKALFILCPLLGVNYVFVLLQPNSPLWAKLVFSYYFTVMTSLQGSLVAVLFCFRNNEVWQTIRRSLRIWIRVVGIRRGGGSQKALRRSMRLDTQSSVMIDLETSSAGRLSRKSLAFDLTAPNNSVKNQSRNASKRSANVIIMRDDGELRLFLPHSLSTSSGSKKASSRSAKQDSVEQPSQHRAFGGKRHRERYSLPAAPTNSLSRNASNNVSGNSAKNQPSAERRQTSNYRPVRGADSIDSAQARRTRYAYSHDRTSIF